MEAGHCEVVVTPFRRDGTLLLADSSLFLFLKNCEEKKTICFFVIFSLPLSTKSCFWFLINSQHTSQQMLFEKILSGTVLFSAKATLCGVWQSPLELPESVP